MGADSVSAGCVSSMTAGSASAVGAPSPAGADSPSGVSHVLAVDFLDFFLSFFDFFKEEEPNSSVGSASAAGWTSRVAEVDSVA